MGKSYNYLLFPGRHLVNTSFQEQYLQKLLGLEELKGATVIFAITSANQENSRYNPIPFHVRAIGVDRFAREMATLIPFKYRIFGIPHYGHTTNFARFTIQEIACQSENGLVLHPDNCAVVCSTPEVIALYEDEGFTVLRGELDYPNTPHPTPIQLVQEIGRAGAQWRLSPQLISNLGRSHRLLFEDFPEVPERVARLYRDPLTNDQGSLTDNRNYVVYAGGMAQNIEFKYLDIKDAISPGRIVDEGCADGALLARISRDFRDSDLFGIDLCAEFARRFQERQTAGEFGDCYVHFFSRNVLDRVFEPASIDTTICNSTTHELWSYAGGEQTIRDYLAKKFAQTRPGGRLIIRDVVGPEAGEQEVILQLCATDGTFPDLPEGLERPAEFLQKMSTWARFSLFFKDFKPLRHLATPYEVVGPIGNFIQVKLKLRHAAEFLSKKDYLDNWSCEMNEEFAFWSFTDWKQVLREAGFSVLESAEKPSAGSRAYTSDWIVTNRFEGKVRLSDLQGNPLPWPPTNMVLVAEKPAH